MTCYYCSYSWCWICGKAYTPDHLAAFNPKGCSGARVPDGKATKKCYGDQVCCSICVILMWLVIVPVFLVFVVPMFVPTYLVFKTRTWKCGNKCFRAILITLMFLLALIFSIPLCFFLVFPLIRKDIKRRDKARLLKGKLNALKIRRGEMKMFNR